jgi:hypothetical protein
MYCYLVLCTSSLARRLLLCTQCHDVGEILVSCSNGNASETKANENFDNCVFFDIEAKRTRSIEILYLNRGKKAKFRFFIKTKGKKLNCSIMD